MKTLLLDIGNSRLKWGVHENDAIEHVGGIELRKLRDQGMSTLTSRLPRDVDLAIACNVADKRFAGGVSESITERCGQDVFFVQSAAKACGVTNAYDEPGRLGVDRWVAMIGARAACRGACLVVDAGTAITLDALDADGRHLGGQIIPGLFLMAETLGKNTTDLPSISEGMSSDELSGLVFARSTTAAIAHGIHAAAAGAVERAMRTLVELGHDPTLLLTGGDAVALQNSLQIAAELRPHLVLEGLARLSLDSKK